MRDPYEVLGLKPGASEAEIKSAYRKLVRQNHPDLHPNDKKAEERFKEISAAYDVLRDPEKLKQEEERRTRTAAGGAGATRQGFDFGDFGASGGFESIFAEMMRRKARGQKAQDDARRNSHYTGHEEVSSAYQQSAADDGFNFGFNFDDAPVRGRNAHYTLQVGFIEAVLGGTKRIDLPSGKRLDVKIPQGATSGQTLRLRGQGEGSPNSKGKAGDALVKLQVEPHPQLVRQDPDILLDLAVSVQEAVLGGKVATPTVDGVVNLTIPPGSNTGTVLRLKGKGVPGAKGRGDQLVTLKVVLPTKDEDFKKAVEDWGPKHPYNPRV